MGGQRCTRFFPQTRHHVQHTGGQACLQGQLGHAQSGEAGVLCRFEHGGIAHGQGGCHGTAQHLCGVVPRNDVGGHAQGLTNQADLMAVQEGNDFAVHFVGGSAIKLKVTGQHLDVIASGGDGFAGVAGFQLGQLFFVVQNFVGNLDQHATFFSQVHLTPWA